jgi:3-oxoacyl-(acyl-carrier-protein) synthase
VSGAIQVAGVGAVSCAGWTATQLCEAVRTAAQLPAKELARPGWNHGLQVRQVPGANPRPAFFAHPRFRRTSPISLYAVAAALEALGPDRELIARRELKLGIVVCVMSGCVNYSRRFYDELLRDPSTASPLVFPETVFNAPASHIGALLNCTCINYTVVGDAGTFLQGLAMAADWLQEGRVDGCLVIAAEEADWLTSEAARLFEEKIILGDGAGALYLKASSGSAQLKAVTDSHLFLNRQDRNCAALKMKAELPELAGRVLLCDSATGFADLDAAEINAWKNWSADRVSVKKTLGEGLAASSAWQCVFAVDSLRSKKHDAATISVLGSNQQAIGAVFSCESCRE